jgi:hypothetical protein
MQENYNDAINELESPKRPTLLSVVCILTFIGSALMLAMYLIIPAFADAVVDALKNSPDYQDIEATKTLFQILQAGWGYYSCLVLLVICSAIGAVLMWKLKRLGFYIYALANLLALFIPTLFFGFPPAVIGMIITAGFIVLYAIHLKFLK